MIKINVFSEERVWSQRLKNKEIFFKKICNSFPKKYKFHNKNMTISLMLSNNKNIKRLNKSFRNKNKPTDVLSFPFNKKKNKLLISNLSLISKKDKFIFNNFTLSNKSQIIDLEKIKLNYQDRDEIINDLSLVKKKTIFLLRVRIFL